MKKNRKTAGQGLIEYALILIFVAVVVIVVLALVGPSIGNVYSELLDGMQMTQVAQSTPVPTDVPTPIPTPVWTFCANEGDFCAFTGTKEVRYGANNTFNYRTVTHGIACNNGVFGDPLNGVFKYCYYR